MLVNPFHRMSTDSVPYGHAPGPTPDYPNPHLKEF
jgi:hypothetical protein